MRSGSGQTWDLRQPEMAAQEYLMLWEQSAVSQSSEAHTTHIRTHKQPQHNAHQCCLHPLNIPAVTRT